MKNYFLTEENVKVLGRTALIDDVRWCAFSGSGVEFNIKAKKLSFEVVGDSAAGDYQNSTRLAVYVDGQRVISEMILLKKKIIDVFETEEEQSHVITIVKLSESAMSTIGLKSIITDGEISPKEKKDTFIEFIGDSITCGYGVEDENPLHTFKTSTEDCTQAFAYRTAEKLSVDYSLVSFSGYGVISGFTGTGEINTIELLPKHYEKTGFSYGKSGDKEKPFEIANIPWSFDNRQPDVVVINLGTNDASYCGEDKEKQQGYINNYFDFLKVVRKNNPKAFIVCGLGVMGDVLYPSMCEAVGQFKETIDERIDTVYFAPINPETEGYVADYHPTSRTHERVSDILAEKIREILKKD